MQLNDLKNSILKDLGDNNGNLTYKGNPITSGASSSPTSACVRTATSQVISTSTVTAVTFGTESVDIGGCANLNTYPTRLTAPVAGIYTVGYTLIFSANSAGGRQAWVSVNGGTVRWAEASVPSRSSNNYTSLGGTVVLNLAAGDYVEVYTYQNSGGNLGLFVDATTSSAAWFVLC